jgi:tetratricopeptide (TPR) repeat protein
MDVLAWYYQRRMLNAMVQNSWKDAKRYIDALITRSGYSMGLTYNLALITLGNGDAPGAYSILERAVEDYGESLRLCRLLGDISYAQGERNQAIRWYDLALTDHPSEKELRLVQKRRELLSDPVLYTRVLTVLPLLPQALAEMERDPDHAVVLYRKIVSCDPTQVEALNNLGVLAQEHLHDSSLAIDCFSKVLELVDHTGATRNLAKTKKSV